MFERLKAVWLFATTRSGRTIAQLEMENDQLRTMLSERLLDETRLVDFAIANGGLAMGLRGGAAQLLAEMLADQIESTGAVNYLEVRFTSRTIAPGERYLVTIQKCVGKTPHELRLAAECELARLSATAAARIRRAAHA